MSNTKLTKLLSISLVLILSGTLIACQTDNTTQSDKVTSNVANASGPIMEGSKEDIDAVLKVFADWGSARDAGNVDGVVAVHDTDMLIMTRNQTILRGHEGVRAFYAQNYYEGSTREMFNQVDELRVIGDVAVVIGRFLVIDKPKNIEAPGYYLIMLRRNDSGEWKIYRDIDTPSPDGLLLNK